MCQLRCTQQLLLLKLLEAACNGWQAHVLQPIQANTQVPHLQLALLLLVRAVRTPYVLHTLKASYTFHQLASEVCKHAAAAAAAAAMT
jgi:hypothetical protein